MKVSVVIATYNGALYLAEQLDSICNQTVHVDEIVICDDQSTDDTVDVIKQYMKEHEQQKIRFYENEINLGYAENFNKALNLAEGEYIFFSDQDDIWNEKKIQIMLETMDKYPECKLLCSDYEVFSTGQNAPTAPKKILNQMPNDGSIEKICLSKQSIYLRTLGCCMCMKKEFREWMHPYWFSDWAQDDRCWKLAQCAEGCYLLHLNLVKHRLHGNNTATFGKYHTMEKRIKLFRHMYAAAEQMVICAKNSTNSRRKQRELQRHLKMMALRLEMLEDRKIINVAQLIFYMRYYQKKKSLLVEMYMAVKGRGK